MSENTNVNNNTTKEFEIDWNGEKKTVSIRKMGFVEKQRFMEKFVKTTVKTGKNETESVNIVIHPFERKIHALQLCIVSAPFKWKTEEQLNEVDTEIGEKIYDEIEILNKLNESAKKKSKDIAP